MYCNLNASEKTEQHHHDSLDEDEEVQFSELHNFLSSSKIELFLQGFNSDNPVADLGFHEGGFVRSGTLARLRGCEKFCKPRPLPAKTTPFYVVEQYPGVELGVCLRFILAACSLEVVYTGKIAITVDTKNRHDH